MKLGESKTFTTSCNDESGKPIDFDESETFTGKINIQYYFKDEGPTNLRRIIGNIQVNAN